MGGSRQENLRSFLVFLSYDHDCDDDSVSSEDCCEGYDDCRDEDEEVILLRCDNTAPMNILLSLQIVAHSLELVLSLDSVNTELQESRIDFECPFWSNAVAAIVYNIEMLPDNEITGISLKCLRLLHSMEPILVKQMMQQSLMPYIIHLREYGESHRCPMIESEARLL